MKRILTTLIVLAAVASPFTAEPIRTNRHATNVAYVCTGPKAYAWHSTPHCKGLNKCQSGIDEVTIAYAEGTLHRRPCKICAQ